MFIFLYILKVSKKFLRSSNNRFVANFTHICFRKENTCKKITEWKSISWEIR